MRVSENEVIRAETAEIWRKMEPNRFDASEQSKVSNAGAVTLMEIRDLDARGADVEARSELRSLIARAPTPANIAGAARMWAQFEESPLSGEREVRVALVGTGTLDALGAHLRVAIAGADLHPHVYVGQFGQWGQELLVPDSALYAFAPEIVFVSLSPTELFPKTLCEAFAPDVDSKNEREHSIASILDALRALAKTAPKATIILSTFAVPDYSPFGSADLSMGQIGQRYQVEQINSILAARLRSELPSVILFDIERAESRFGKMRSRDYRRWYLASIPYSDEFSWFLALEFLRVIRPLKGLNRKCVVVDLDNTLWGGVVGEDGFAGVKVGGSVAPGNAFRDFQIVLENLRRRGILLAICSKNNESDAMAALEQHPGMVLRPSSFAATRINWDDKAANIVSIARELNIGLDSLVFLDDSPAERGLVRERLPEVLTVDLPRDPALYASTVEALDVFDTLTLTEEDRRRTELYAAQRDRARFEREIAGTTSDGMDPAVSGSSAGNTPGLHKYLFDLAISVRLAEASESDIARIAQLINKTNQFNLTTRRYTESQVREMARDQNAFGIYTVHVSDRFGDSGLTGVAIVRKSEHVWQIDSFLLSCRVLGRGIEQSLLRFVALDAAATGCDKLQGMFISTPKNAPAADFYERMGFNSRGLDASTPEAQLWDFDFGNLEDQECPLATYPEWLSVDASVVKS